MGSPDLGSQGSPVGVEVTSPGVGAIEAQQDVAPPSARKRAVWAFWGLHSKVWVW